MKKLTLTQTIIMLSVVMISLQLIYGVISNIRVNTMGHHLGVVETQLVPINEHMVLVMEYQLEQEIEFERTFRYAFEMSERPLAINELKQSVKHFDELTIKVDKELDSTSKMIQLAVSQMDDENANNQLLNLGKELALIKKKHTKWVEDIQGVFTLLKAEKINAAIVASHPIEEQIKELEKAVFDKLALTEKLTAQVLHKVKEEEESILSFSIGLLIFSIVVSAALTRWITSNLNNDLSALSTEVARMAGGNVFDKVTSKLGKEFGLNTMRQNLHDVLTIVERTSNEMLDASSELAQVSAEISQTADLQSQEIELISTAMTEMEATSQEVARHAESTKASTAEATATTATTKETTSNAMVAISKLTDSLNLSSENLAELEKNSANIISVLDVIKAIADQTNLLALNAAIEAARAGDQGRGFAVVADEVRNLAKRTQDSTVEIESMLTLFSQGTSDAVSSMADSIVYGEESNLAASEANSKLDIIQTEIEEINDMNSQIATAAEEQSCTTQELSQNTIRVNQLTNESTTSIAQISTASEELAQISLSLKERLSKFTLS